MTHHVLPPFPPALGDFAEHIFQEGIVSILGILELISSLSPGWFGAHTPGAPRKLPQWLLRKFVAVQTFPPRLPGDG